MNKLTSEQRAEKAALVDKIATAKADVEKAIADYNDAVAAAYSKVEDEVTHYNSVLQEARNFIEDVHAEMESHVEAQSEAWQDSDAGAAYDTWKDDWEEMQSTLEDYDLEERHSLSEPDDVGAEFEELADAPAA